MNFQNLGGQISAVPTPIFVAKYSFSAFFEIILQGWHVFAPFRLQNLSKKSSQVWQFGISRNTHSFDIFQNVSQRARVLLLVDESLSACHETCSKISKTCLSLADKLFWNVNIPKLIAWHFRGILSSTSISRESCNRPLLEHFAASQLTVLTHPERSGERSGLSGGSSCACVFTHSSIAMTTTTKTTAPTTTKTRTTITKVLGPLLEIFQLCKPLAPKRKHAGSAVLRLLTCFGATYDFQ